MNWTIEGEHDASRLIQWINADDARPAVPDVSLPAG